MNISNDDRYIDFVRVLEICRDLECYSAELYRLYSKAFLEDEETSKMWARLAVEEDGHANQFVLAINLRKQNMIESVTIDLFTAQTALNVVKSIYDQARKSKPTLADALRSSIKLEERLRKFHMDSIAAFVDEGHKKMFAALMKADEYHLQALEDAYRKLLGNPAVGTHFAIPA